MIFRNLLFLILLLPFSYLLGQENFVIDKNLNYSLTTNPFDVNEQQIIFEDAINHEAFGTIPVLNIQIPIDYNIDSLSINIFDKEIIKQSFFPKSSTIIDSKPYIYETQTVRNKKYISIFYNPFIILEDGSTGAYKKIQLLVTVYPTSQNKINKQLKGNSKWAPNSVLATGDWYKIALSTSGIYKVSGAQLISMGISLTNLSVNNLRLYGNGGGMYPELNNGFFFDDLSENPIKVYDLNNNGLFEETDYFIFNGQGPNSWKINNGNQNFTHTQHLYDNFAYYFITIKSGVPKRIQTIAQNTQTPNITINEFNDFKYYDKDSLNLIKSGKQWFGDEFDIVLSHQYSFNFPNLVISKPVNIKLSVAGRSTTNSQMNVLANGNSKTVLIPSVLGTYNSDYAIGVNQEFTILSSNPQVIIDVTYLKSTSTSIGWMDYIEVNAIRELKMDGDQMSFRNPITVGINNISKFELENANQDMQIWDITNPTNPLNLDYDFNAGTISFIQETDSLREFIAFNNNFLIPTFVNKIENQNLHSSANVDYVICYDVKFIDQVNELANYHRNTNKLSVLTVEQKKLFNEYSSGAADIAALRNFMKMLYDNAITAGQTPPRYLLLFGDGSYDPKNRIQNNTNYILTYESATSLTPTGSYSSDDFFGLLDDGEGSNCNGALDLGIGRFTVSTTEEASHLVNKVKRYQAIHNGPTGSAGSITSSEIPNMADWRNVVCFIGDDQDDNIHVTQADYLAEYVRRNYLVYNIDKIYLDSYVQQTLPGGQRYPDAKRDLNLRVRNGALVINYTGHGGEIGLAHESLLEINDIINWTNKDNLSLFITATCEFSRYDDPSRISAGEYTYLQENGGVLALLTTSRLTFSNSNFTLNKNIVGEIFKKENGIYPTIGEVIQNAKVLSGSLSPVRNFVLLGDPSLKLAYPEFEVKTMLINNTPISQFTDTLKSLSTVTITGQVESGGQLLSNFNGLVYPTIYDKAQTFTTLGNDFNSYPYNFILQKNILYKGKSSVVNGQFSFSFIVPKDINYSIGLGKISYYAENGSTDASGYYDSLIIGGSSTNQINDNDGPQITLFVNDTLFIDGGITNENPVIIGLLEDINGINTTGNGIGHDITLTLDNTSSSLVSLNNFYQSKVNSFQSGYVIYPLSNLSDGHHVISLKAWDVLNNSNTASLNFVVANNESTLISSIMNFPNPFSDFTSFVFEHNMAGTKMDIVIDIYDAMGNEVRRLQSTVEDIGFKVSSADLKWTGTGENGQELRSGIYNYRIIVTTNVGETASKGGKLVLLN